MRHIIDFAKIPQDIRAAYQVAQLTPHCKSVAVRASADGYWGLAVTGNPITLEEQFIRFFPGCFAGSPTWFSLRRIKKNEIELFDLSDQKVLSEMATDEDPTPNPLTILSLLTSKMEDRL